MRIEPTKLRWGHKIQAVGNSKQFGTERGIVQANRCSGRAGNSVAGSFIEGYALFVVMSAVPHQSLDDHVMSRVFVEVARPLLAHGAVCYLSNRRDGAGTHGPIATQVEQYERTCDHQLGNLTCAGFDGAAISEHLGNAARQCAARIENSTIGIVIRGAGRRAVMVEAFGRAEVAKRGGARAVPRRIVDTQQACSRR